MDKEVKFEKKEIKKEVVKKVNSKKGVRISGIKGEYILFRFNKVVKRVPVGFWKGGEEQSFSDKEFNEFVNN